MIAFGVQTNPDDTSTVTDITFAGKTYVFENETTDSVVTNDDVEGDETGNNYTSWHQGYEGATKNQQVTADGLELASKSQVIKGLDNNSANVNSVNVNLAFALRSASYQVEEGSATFQIPLFFDNGSGVKFTTLRNDGTPGDLQPDGDWQSSQVISGSVGQNTDYPLSDIISALGKYKVVGYGVQTHTGGSALVSSIDFGGAHTEFSDAGEDTTQVKVTNDEVADDESTYAGWHQGAEPATDATIADGTLNLGPDRSQVIKGYANNSANTNAKNVDLAEALRTGSFEVTSGSVSFQVPLFFEDEDGDTQFTTLRPAADAGAGSHEFSIRDEWITSQPLGDLPVNGSDQLGDILSSIGAYKVIGFGVFQNAGGNGKISSITWDGVENSFAKLSSTTDFTRTNPTSPSSKKRFYVYATVTAEEGASVTGGGVTVTNAGKTIGTGTLNSSGKVKIQLNRKLAKGNRTITIKFDGTSEVAPSKESRKVKIK